ncbi:MAG: GNAT family N-acetyltransferase [Burkholderiales bacterium]|nr:GNAT family N-acetyltransferase [Burkholderiales bacterium]
MREHDLAEEHIAGGMALSRAANWNQNEADWRMMLRLGKGFGLSAADGTLVASIVLLPYANSFAWMSMVLVSPGHRRLGYASRMLRRALAYLQSRGLVAVLDATPAGHEVYVQEGLHDTWGFQRYSLPEAPPISGWQDVSGLELRHIADGDWPQILALDLPAFGASREPFVGNIHANEAAVRERLSHQVDCMARTAANVGHGDPALKTLHESGNQRQDRVKQGSVQNRAAVLSHELGEGPKLRVRNTAAVPEAVHDPVFDLRQEADGTGLAGRGCQGRRPV